MADIAKQAGVSVMTVHRAIHNHPGISPITKDRILKIVSESKYRPNAYARAMRKGRFSSIGLVTEQSSIEMSSVVSIFRVINTKSITLTFAELALDNDDNTPLPKLFTENIVDGVIVHSSIEKNKILEQWLWQSQTPFITLMKDSKYDSIIPDFQNLIPLLIEGIIEAGYDEVVYLGPVNSPQYHLSYYPYRLFLSSVKTKIPSKVISTDIDIPVEKWKKELSDLTSKKQRTAIISLADEARAAYNISQRMKKRIPEDFSIFYIGTRRIFCDDGTKLSGFIYSNYELGELAAKMILEKIEKEIKIPSVRLSFKSVIGDTASCNFFEKLNIKN